MTRPELEKLLARPIPRISGEIDVTGVDAEPAKAKDR
jgi:hypothetical protein